MSEARALALYALALHAVAHALFAWDAATAASPLRAVAWGWALAAALLLGDGLGPRLAAAAEGLGRGRLPVVAAGLHLALALLLPPLVAADARLLGGEVVLFAMLQVALLSLCAFEPGRMLAVGNALVLTALAALRGGVLGATAAIGTLAWLGPLLAFEHYDRTLAWHPRSRRPPVAVAALRGAGSVAAPVVAMAALVALAPPGPYRPAARAGAVPPMGDVTAAYHMLTLLGVLGGSGVYLIARLLRRFRRAEPTVAESVEAVQMDEEVLPPAPPRRAAATRGRRGRIVRAYLSFVAQAGQLRVRRRPADTPLEFAAQVREPAGPLGTLTGLFMSARWGPDEPGEEEVRAAERAAAEVIAALRGRGRGGTAGKAGDAHPPRRG